MLFFQNKSEKYKLQLTVWEYKVFEDGGQYENVCHELVKHMLNSALFIHSS